MSFVAQPDKRVRFRGRRSFRAWISKKYKKKFGKVRAWISKKYKKKLWKFAKFHERSFRRLYGSGDPKDATLLGKMAYAALCCIPSGNRYLPIAGHAERSHAIAVLAEPTAFVSEAPRHFNAESVRHCGTAPAIVARMFSEVEASSDSSAIVARDRICIPELYIGRPDLHIVDGAFLLSQAGSIGAAHSLNPCVHPNGIAVFGSGALNWYHWLIEILPSAFLAERLPERFRDFPLVVPEACLKFRNYREALSLFAVNRKIVALLSAAPAKFEKLITIDSVSCGPMNMAPGCWPTPLDYRQHAPAMLSYRDAILERVGRLNAGPAKRIFLARDQTRRCYNQDEILAIAQKYGFESVFTERLSFREQIELFAQADIVVGPSGAAFTNLLFCRPETQGLTWLVPQHNGFCAYSNLALVVKMRLHYLNVTPIINVKTTWDTYVSPYHLNGAEFEAALAALVRESSGRAC